MALNLGMSPITAAKQVANSTLTVMCRRPRSAVLAKRLARVDNTHY